MQHDINGLSPPTAILIERLRVAQEDASDLREITKLELSQRHWTDQQALDASSMLVEWRCTHDDRFAKLHQSPE